MQHSLKDFLCSIKLIIFEKVAGRLLELGKSLQECTKQAVEQTRQMYTEKYFIN